IPVGDVTFQQGGQLLLAVPGEPAGGRVHLSPGTALFLRLGHQQWVDLLQLHLKDFFVGHGFLLTGAGRTPGKPCRWRCRPHWRCRPDGTFDRPPGTAGKTLGSPPKPGPAPWPDADRPVLWLAVSLP